MINDEEDLLEALQVYVKANLNSNITAINTEKNDDIKIDSITVDDDHYVFAGELLDLPNHIFVNFAINGEIDVKNNYDDKSSTLNLMVEVVMDNAKKRNGYWQSLRYMRALYETILDFESSTNEVGDLQLTKLIPMVASLNQRQMIISGVGISVSMG